MLKTRKACIAIVLLITIAIAATSRFASAADSAASTGPMAQMKGLADRLFAMARTPECQSDMKACRNRLSLLVEAHWDRLEMARMALGVHWKPLDDNERQRFADLFGDLTEAIYLSRANLSKAENFAKGTKVDFVREVFDGDNYSQVNTFITLSGREKPISVNYSLKRDGTVWKAYDVHVDGISIVSNYRNQFNRVINSQGYPALVRDLQEKVRQINSSQG
jgi:phospholipid transport system substrate-binding protein